MKKFKKIICMLLIVTMLPIFGGCSSTSKSSSSSQASSASSSASDTITITDQAGDEVTLPSKIERIAVCDILPLPSVLAIFFNSADKIVGMSEPSMTAAKNGLLGQLYPEILNADTGFIKDSEVNTEELLKLKPDVVFYGASDPEIGSKLKEAGFNAVAISVNKWEYNSIETLNNWIDLLSQIFPEDAKADKVEKYSNEIYDMVQERVKDIPDDERANVFFLFKYDETSIVTSGNQFFGSWWAKAIGAKNVADDIDKDNAVPINMEQIYKYNPEIIFITNFTQAQPEDLYNNTIGSNDWSKIQAVQDKKVYKTPLGMYRSYTPGADTPMTLLWYAKTVYPDLFEDIDLNEEVEKYYKEVFDVELTEEQVESIFAPTSDAAKGF
ncbi:ABC transporter substrate-binding protein [Intestinibacter sp.]|uniref:ABC transporter substrate-binding protein n=1 Tax=Intestinibacter sp. TaxID=1965304 RepID=UPI003F17C7EB